MSDLSNANSAHSSSDRLCCKILLLVTEDWFALSHFQPMITVLVGLADEVVVVTRTSGREGELEALGVRVHPFDFRRSSLNPAAQAMTVRGLAQLIGDEKPDVVHVISLQAMVMCALTGLVTKLPRVMMHLTGLGFLGISNSLAAKVIRPFAFRALASQLKKSSSWMLAENPEDVSYMRENGVTSGSRLTLLGGAGIDETAFPALPELSSDPARAAFVGRMIRSKGLDVLIDAKRLLNDRGVGLDITLYGKTDDGNREGIPASRINQWQDEGLVTWAGHVSDIGAVWADADIAVLPAISREGMPRSVLEAASSARAVVVTDVPGCRHFVRDGVEGFVVPPDDATALADALARLAQDPDLRATMGQAARQRVLDGYTISHVKAGVRDGYRGLMANAPVGAREMDT